ncbi:MAG: type II secretion system protein GspD [Phycisphaeraceae bacterium]|nr:type II secretion system protein GspD [Phycisphaeraceae bacterium]
MRRKHIGTVLSSGVLMCCVLFMASDVNAQSLSIRKKQFQISGSVNVPGVVMKGLPGAVITDATGKYSATVDYNWSGSITPDLAGYEFTPRTRSVRPVKAQLPDYDFAGTIQMFVISGTVGLPNVTIHGFSQSVLSSGPSGKFEVKVAYGDTLKVIPELEGYSFSPPLIEFPQVNRNYLAQRFMAAKQRFTISGMVSSEGGYLSNVPLKIKGAAKAVKTGGDGRYSVEVTYGDDLTITPEREGYTFYPETMPYVNVTANEITNYDATQLRYTVTGNVGVENAHIKYAGGSTLSDAMGNYSFELNHGARFSILPERDGYRFSPPEISHMRLISHLVNQSFKAQEIVVTIAGNTGTPGVLLDGLNDISGQPVTSDAQGYYRAQVKYNETLAVMPIKPGFTFKPASRPYANLKQDQLKETYTAEALTFEISGNVGMRRVKMVGPQGTFESDPAGDYTVRVPFDWIGTITPELPGYQFDPPFNKYENVRENLYSNQNYYPEKKMYTITGLVTSVEGPIDNANIRLGGLGGLTFVTDSQGRYSLDMAHGESGRLTVDKAGYEFASHAIDIPPVAQSRQFDFTGKIRKMKIRGRLLDGDQPVREVRLTASNGGGVTVSDPQGKWLIEVPYDWTGEISMEKPGMEIDMVLLFDVPVIEDIDMTKPEPSVPDVRPGSPAERVDAVPLTRAEATERVESPAGTGETDIMPSGALFDELDDPNSLIDTPSTMAPGVQELMDEVKQLRRVIDRQSVVKTDDAGKAIDRGPLVTKQTYAGDDLAGVLSEMGDEVGIPIIADVDVVHDTYVSHGAVPLEVALNMLVAGTNFSWIEADGYYLVSTMSPLAMINPAFVPGSVTQTMKMAYLPAASAVSMLADSMQKFVKAEPQGSYVIVTAGPQLVERIMADLRSFDLAPKQVLLQSKVVVMEEGDLLNLGVEWSWPSVSGGLFSGDSRGTGVNTDFDTGGKGIWGMQIGYSLGTTFTNALTMGLNLLQENDKAQMIANPSVMGTDGTLAVVSIMNEEYFMLLPNVGTEAQVFANSELETITSGVKLEITPRITDANEILLEIAVELSDSIPSGRASGLPVVTRRTAASTVRISDGGSAVIAGLNENRKTSKEKRTPGLSSIPLLGKLFSNTTKDTASRDVAIFVTANIIKDEKPVVSPAPIAAPPVNPVYQPPMPVGNMNSFTPNNTAPRATMPRPQYNAPSGQYNNTPNVNPPGSYDSFQAELRRTIAEQRRNNSAAFNN